MSDIRFSDLTLSQPVLDALAEMGYETPTPVQESAVPMATTGQDLMVQSQTGTGKTAAFGIPLIETLDADKGIKGLVLCPTRELARQVAEELTRLGHFKQIRTAAVYGGGSLDKQVAEMRFAQIVVGTPGRVLDHLKRKNISFKGVRALVLDEADEMLSMGFAQELEQIMRFVPVDRQTLLFSATIPPDVKRYATKYMREPEFLSLIEENVASDEVTHQYFMVSGVGRSRDLVRIIQLDTPSSAIIFTNTRKDCEVVARALRRADYDAEYLNSDLSQRERERVMKRMKDKDLRFLVATDIAARGIDISQLSHVINYTLPESPEVYIHRTGRTGRAGNKGTALSLIGPREIGVYYYLKRIYEVALEERTLPSATEIDLRRIERRTEELVSKLKKSLAVDKLDKLSRNQAAHLLERDDAIELVQILLAHYQKPSRQQPAESFGGLLKEVPKPERIAPGSRKASIEGIASRVATIRGEYRGLPGGQAPESTESKETDAQATETAPKDTAAEHTPPKMATRQARAKSTKADTPSGRRASTKDKVRATSAQRSATKKTQTEAETDQAQTKVGSKSSAKDKVRAASAKRAAAKKTEAAAATEEATTGAGSKSTAKDKVRAASAKRTATRKAQAEAKTAECVEQTSTESAAAKKSDRDTDDKPKSKRRTPRRTSAKRSAEVTAETQRHPKSTRAQSEPDSVAETKSTKPSSKTSKRSSSAAKRLIEQRVRQRHQTTEPKPADMVAETVSDKATTPPAKGDIKAKLRSKLKARTSTPAAQAPVAPLEQDDSPKTSKRRNSRAEKSERRSKPLPALEPGTVRLFLNLGARDELNEADLREEFADLAGLYPEDILSLDLRGRHTYIVLDEEFTDDVIAAVSGARFSGKRLRIEVARQD